MEVLTVIAHILAWLAALVFGIITSESIVFGEKQSIYKRGVDSTLGWKASIAYQFDNYMKDRADNLLKKIGLSVGLVLIVGLGGNAAGITSYLTEKLGFEGLSINLGGSAVCFILLAFGEFIGRKLGLIKEDKLED